jgi:hypothetical protein
MKRTTVFLDEGLESDLHAIARRQKRTLASLVREALDGYVNRQVRHRPKLRFTAVGSSGRPDTADRHEELLFRELHPHGERKPPSPPRASKKR